MGKYKNNMEWIQFVIFCIGVGGLWLWQRTESRNDIRHMDAKLDANRELIREVHQESTKLIQSMSNEMKDFHYRLLEIEKGRK